MSNTVGRVPRLRPPTAAGSGTPAPALRMCTREGRPRPRSRRWHRRSRAARAPASARAPRQRQRPAGPRRATGAQHPVVARRGAGSWAAARVGSLSGHFPAAAGEQDPRAEVGEQDQDEQCEGRAPSARRGPAGEGCSESWRMTTGMFGTPAPKISSFGPGTNTLSTMSKGAVSPAARAMARIAAGGDAAGRGGQDHPEQRAPAIDAESVGSIAQARRHESKHLLAGPRDQREHDDGQRDGPSEARVVTLEPDQQSKREQTDDHSRHPLQEVEGELERGGDARSRPGEFGQVEPGQHTHRGSPAPRPRARSARCPRARLRCRCCRSWW